MPTNRRWSFFVFTFAAMLVRCSAGGSSGAELDAATPDATSTDAGPDATPADAGHDATGMDARPDGPGAADADAGGAEVTDAGHEAESDATDANEAGATDGSSDDGSDAAALGPDPGPDAGDATPDAGEPASFPPGSFACATCPGGTCGAGCPPGTASCGGSCVAPSFDPANCGACGNACATGDVCVLGACTPRASTVLVSGITGGAALALDATNVYFVDAAGVHSVPRAGGSVTNIADATGTPLRVAVDDTYVYWSESAGSIMRAPKDGSGAPWLVVAASQPQGLAVVGGTVYWVTNTGSAIQYTTQTVYQAPAFGGTASVFATVSDNDPSEIIDDSTSLLEIVAAGTSVYVADREGAFEIPIGPDGGAGASTEVMSGYLGMSNGSISAKPGIFCGEVYGLSARNFACNTAYVSLSNGEVLGASALPACGIVFNDDGLGERGTLLVPDRLLYDLNADVGTYGSSVLTLDQASVIVVDGMTIVLLDMAGEIRLLPLP